VTQPYRKSVREGARKRGLGSIGDCRETECGAVKLRTPWVGRALQIPEEGQHLAPAHKKAHQSVAVLAVWGVVARGARPNIIPVSTSTGFPFCR